MAKSDRATEQVFGPSIDEIRKRYPEFENLLRQRQHEVLGRERAARALLDEQVPNGPGDMADESVLDTSADYFLKLANHQQREMIEIRDALTRLQRGVYGICGACEEPISIERLKRVPYARLCIDCKSNEEKRLRATQVSILPKS